MPKKALRDRPPSPISRPSRRNSVKTRETLLRAAQTEFSRAGYEGARIERVVAAARCNVRMLYHYFGSKKELYLAVLESAYEHLRSKEKELELDTADPLEGVFRLYEFTANYFATHSEFAALLTGENLMRGEVALRSKRIPAMASTLRRSLALLVERGERDGVFRRGIDPVQLYVTIGALSWFHLAYVHTLSSVFKRNLANPSWQRQRLIHGREVLKSYLCAAPRLRRRMP